MNKLKFVIPRNDSILIERPISVTLVAVVFYLIRTKCPQILPKCLNDENCNCQTVGRRGQGLLMFYFKSRISKLFRF